MSQDINLRSFNGPDDNGKTFDLRGQTLDASGGDASAIKCSTGLARCTITAGDVIGGHDACVDVNNLCQTVGVEVARATATGQFIATIKGGCQMVTLKVAQILRRGSVCEVILGDWSDQSHLWCEGVTLDCHMADGSAVRVIVLASEFPVEAPGSGPYRYMYIKPWFPRVLHELIVFGFETLRRWGFWRSQSNA